MLRPSRRPGSYWAQVGLRNVNAGTTNPPPPPRRAQQGTPAGRQGLSGGGGGCPQPTGTGSCFTTCHPPTPTPLLSPLCPKSQLGARRAGAVTPSESGVPPSCYVADHVEVSSRTVCYCVPATLMLCSRRALSGHRHSRPQSATGVQLTTFHLEMLLSQHYEDGADRQKKWEDVGQEIVRRQVVNMLNMRDMSSSWLGLSPRWSICSI